MVQTMEKANEVPTLVFCEEIEMDNLIALRAALLPSAANFGLKLSFLPFIIKATSLTLMHYPSLNAHTTPGPTLSSSLSLSLYIYIYNFLFLPFSFSLSLELDIHISMCPLIFVYLSM
jgi:hypothetical protein